ncbi:MAG: prepilin peptidase [Alphaproteobacteria bacterium]|nr:prepilin peptidase [Alphaproteobacteria bacterium]
MIGNRLPCHARHSSEIERGCHVLEPADLVPVASWLWQRGKCRHCGGSIGRCRRRSLGRVDLSLDAVVKVLLRGVELRFRLFQFGDGAAK